MNENSIMPIDEKPIKLWNFNFILLWQGLLISEVGDIIYDIALSFYVLAQTGSTLMMSYMLAATVLPRVLLSPFAGIIADKSDKISIIVIADLVRGVAILIIGLLGLFGHLQIWMLFIAGIIMGVGQSFFSPTINAVLPDVAHRSKLMAANAAFSLVQALSSILGYFGGGLLYAWLGAFILFILNGVSYLISAVSELYLTLNPKTDDLETVLKSEPKNELIIKTNISREFIDLLKSVWRQPGLRYLLISNALLNYFSFLGLTLILPYFESKKEWGATYYGITMGVFTLGTILGLLLLTKYTIAHKYRARSYVVAAALFSVLLAPAAFISNFWVLVVPIFMAGFCSAVSIVIERNALLSSIVPDSRAKVFGIWSAISSVLTPIGMISAGVLAQYFKLQNLISFVFGILALIILTLSFNADFMNFLNGKDEILEI